MRLTVLFLCLFSLLACRESGRQSSVWFVQITDPHLFDRDPDDRAEAKDPKKFDERRAFQEKLSQAAFADALHALRDLPDTEARPAFLVVTGDWGVDYAADGTVPAGAKPPQQVLAELLAQSPVQDIYYVPGNNDVPKELATREALEKPRKLFSAVQDELRKLGAKVELHDLTSCYFVAATSCTADVPGTGFRLIGFPSHSFKKPQPKEQEPQAEQLAALVDAARRDGKKALILTHIPDIDDPYSQAQDRFAGTPTPWSAWNVSPKVFERWQATVGSGAVAAVLAGHFHDSHRDLYYPPYPWSRRKVLRADPAKTYIAPPLSVRLQDSSPFQARGLALFRLDGDHLSRRLFWYSPSRHTFTPGQPRKLRAGGRWTIGAPQWIGTGWAWLWELGEGGSQSDHIARATVFAIAFLAAFLTVVQVWQIPPPSKRISGAVTTPPGTTIVVQPDQIKTFSVNLLDNNFVRTVLSGLVGLTAVSFLDSFFPVAAKEGAAFNAKSYYLVLFVAFFLSILLLSALWRGMLESVRSRIILRRPMAALPTLPSDSVWKAELTEGYRFRRWSSYWVRRLMSWLSSFRMTFVVFFDTVFNVIQGRNHLQSAVHSDQIVDLHESILDAAERVQCELHHALIQALLRRNALPVDLPLEERVRVNVSLLASDNSSVYYIARERGSVAASFDQHSVAWIAAFLGEARWSKMGTSPAGAPWAPIYTESSEAVLFDNKSGSVPGAPLADLLLKQYFQSRGSEDYKGFIVLPLPWGRRGQKEGRRRGLIHISFKDAALMDHLWQGLETYALSSDKKSAVLVPSYKEWRGLLEPLALSHGRGKEEACVCSVDQPAPAEAAAVEMVKNQMQKLRRAEKDLEIAQLERREEQLKIHRDLLTQQPDSSQPLPIRARDEGLCAALHQALETLGEALGHFDDEVFEDYVRLRRHA